jgi:Flp pilus assembly protein protease CpaA
MWAMPLWNDAIPALQWSVVVSASVVAAMTDIASRRIYNWLTVPVAAGGLAYGTYVGGMPGLAESLAACAILALPYVFLFVFARGGAGDAKMMGAIGAWLGLVNGLAALACVCMAGIVLAIGFSILKGRMKETAANLSGIAYGMLYAVTTRGRMSEPLRAGSSAHAMMTMPYGLAICVGVCAAAVGVLLWRT